MKYFFVGQNTSKTTSWYWFFFYWSLVLKTILVCCCSNNMVYSTSFARWWSHFGLIEFQTPTEKQSRDLQENLYCHHSRDELWVLNDWPVEQHTVKSTSKYTALQFVRTIRKTWRKVSSVTFIHYIFRISLLMHEYLSSIWLLQLVELIFNYFTHLLLLN